MEEILFLAPYPTDETVQDGYFQRIKNIDNKFTNCKRIYLMVTYRKKHEEIILETADLCIYKLNFFKSFFKIRNIVRAAKYIYCHSIYRYMPASFFFKKNQIVTLDFHGIVPEELRFSGNKKASIIYDFIERRAIKRVNNIIVVTEAMKKFINSKYKNNSINFIFYPILTKNVLNNNVENPIKKAENEVVFVYSGNCQPWQRIPDIISFLNNHDLENYTYYFLTLDQEGMRSIIDKNLKKDFKSTIVITTVLPKDLGNYYSRADYGFMIRDDHPLNRVANPTKMMEYMYYGLKLIVDLEDIGDYHGYDFIRYDDKNVKIFAGKSTHNREIADAIVNQPVDSIDELIFRM